jgi:hypothetical protein
MTDPASEPSARRYPSALIAAIGLGIALLYASPFLPEVLRKGITWPIRLIGEGPSLSTYGKWWVHAPHHYMVDGFSGEFPTFYNYLSDTLLNVLAAAFQWPPMTVQAVLYGPLLGALFFWLNNASVRAVTGDARAALLASLILSLGGGSGLPYLWPGMDGDALDRVLHVPFHAISLGTSQSLGWVLFLPSLALLYLARERFRVRYAVGFGVATGLLFHTHTLTFLNAAFAGVVYLSASLAGRIRGRRRLAWVLALSTVALAFAARAAFGPPLGSFVLMAAAGCALFVDFLFDPDRRPYVWGYGAAVVVAAPYLAALARDVAGVAGIVEQGLPSAVTTPVLLAFFAPYAVGAGLAFGRASEGRVEGGRVLGWLVSILGATFLFSQNHLWNWGNHPYRFAIHLLFPLALLAVLGLRDAGRLARAVLGLWILGVIVYDVGRFATGHRLYAKATPVQASTGDFLRRIRILATGAGGQSILNPPEFYYPYGLTQNALVFNYSNVPGFIPDYRYLLARERYFNRLGVFCFLFPGYPASDHHLNRRACDEPLDPPASLVSIREPRLRAAILPVYGITFAAASGNPFGEHLAAAQAAYGWATVTEGDDRRRLVRTDAPRLPGLAVLARGSAEGRTIPFTTSDAGPHLLVLGGRALDRRAPRVLVDGREVTGRREGNWALLRDELRAGEHRLELPAPGIDRDGERDVIYFLAIVHASSAGGYLEGMPGAR